jgi:glycine cleavage system H lipoate-binding protein
MILRTRTASEEKCTTPAFATCASAREHLKDLSKTPTCPFLQERSAQFCAAAPVTTYVPMGGVGPSRCTTGNHRYCELYQSRALPEETLGRVPFPSPSLRDDGTGNVDYRVEGVRVPRELWFTSNHMWLDLDSDGGCHIGIDGFFARVLGHLEKIIFMPSRKVGRPTVVLSVKGTNLPVVFPKPICLSGVNSQLRSHPDRLLTHPYSLGWLFEGTSPEGRWSTDHSSLCSDLLQGEEAASWMRREVRRLDEFARDHITRFDASGRQLVADGGAAIPRLTDEAGPEDLLQLFHEFFSPYSAWRMPS